MLDLNNLPTNPKVNRQVFSPPTGAWTTWVKPRGVNFVRFVVLGAGGGGGGGGTSNGSGGGGGSGAQITAFMSTSFLPDVLFVTVGTGGAGAASGTGNTGGGTYICLYPSTSNNANILF